MSSLSDGDGLVRRCLWCERWMWPWQDTVTPAQHLDERWHRSCWNEMKRLVPRVIDAIVAIGETDERG